MGRTAATLAAVTCVLSGCFGGTGSASSAATAEPTTPTRSGSYGVRCGDHGPTMFHVADIGKIDVHYVNPAQLARVRQIERSAGEARLWFTFVDMRGIEKDERFLIFRSGDASDPCNSGVELLNGRPHESFSPNADYPYVIIGPE
jgi:hypothetical protein